MSSPKEQYAAGRLTGGNERSRTYTLPAAPGPKQCRWCWGPVTEKRKRTWCSTECVKEYDELRMALDPGLLRDAVYQRDQGVCAICKLDTEWLRRTLWPRFPKLYIDDFYTRSGEGMDFKLKAALKAILDYGHGPLAEFAEAIEARGKALAQYPWVAKRRWDLHLYEVDHILPVVEGGGCTGLDNLRTLCLPCHWKVTAELRARLARKPSKKYNAGLK